jgi:4'-phosphopantetheinyl transferase
VDRFFRTLSPDEVERAERFRFERHRRRFVVGRGVLRALLGRYLGVEPARISFGYGARGKPHLSGALSGTGVRFNLAHSHEMALYVVTRGRDVGIDLEHVRPMPDAEDIGARFFSPHEHEILCALPPGQRLGAFFDCWTRKEAYIKATGDGLARPLDEFDVSLAPGEPARLLRVAEDPAEVDRWSLQALSPDAGYAAALVVEGRGWRLACWCWAE